MAETSKTAVLEHEPSARSVNGGGWNNWKIVTEDGRVLGRASSAARAWADAAHELYACTTIKALVVERHPAAVAVLVPEGAYWVIREGSKRIGGGERGWRAQTQGDAWKDARNRDLAADNRAREKAERVLAQRILKALVGEPDLAAFAEDKLRRYLRED